MTPETMQAAERIRQSFSDRAEALRSNANLSSEGLRARLARAYLEAKTEMQALQTRQGDDVQSRIRALNAKVWGLDDIAGRNGTDRASASVSYRDAQDRAAAVETMQGALALLVRAEATGDELLARALAARAASEPLSGWGDVLEAYFNERPQKVAAYLELRDLSRSPRSGADIFAFAVPVPQELGTMPEYQVQALADDSRFLGA